MANIYLALGVGILVFLMVISWGRTDTLIKAIRTLVTFCIVILAILAGHPTLAVALGLLCSLFLAAVLIGLVGPKMTKLHFISATFGWLLASIFFTPPYELFEFWVVAIVVTTVIFLEISFTQAEESLDLRVLSILVSGLVVALGLTALITNQLTMVFVSTILLFEATILLMNLKIRNWFIVILWVVTMTFQITLLIVSKGS